MGEAAGQECAEGHGRALDEEERRELLRLQEPCRRGQGAQADPQMGCDRLSALTGGVRVASCKRTARSPARRQNGPRSGTHLRTSAATARSAEAELAESWYCSRCP